jgi:hypothetical protein
MSMLDLHNMLNRSHPPCYSENLLLLT